jgi:hypothetical protein
MVKSVLPCENKSKHKANKKKNVYKFLDIGYNNLSRTQKPSHAFAVLSSSHLLKHSFSIKRFPSHPGIDQNSPGRLKFDLSPTLQPCQQCRQWQGGGEGKFLKPSPYSPLCLWCQNYFFIKFIIMSNPTCPSGKDPLTTSTG